MLNYKNNITFAPVSLFKTTHMREAKETVAPDSLQTVAGYPCTLVHEEIKETKLADLYNKVKYYLDEEKVFLNPELSLAKLSLIVGTNTLHS